MVEKRFLGISEFSELMGISKNTAYSWVHQRKIPFIKVGRLVKFDMKAMEKWLEEHTVKSIKWD
jgi:excisionase family DNA binding protein